jgi:hypothetical protein
LSKSKICYFADKVHVHHWPKNSPTWSESLQQKLNILINKNSQKKEIIFGSNDIHIENVQFTSLQKIGISVPFFKEECTIIFEAQFEQVFAHVHITFKSDTFLDIFNQLTLWKNKFPK